MPEFFIPDYKSYLSQECLYPFTQNFIHSEKGYGSLKLVKKSYNFDHISQSLKFFKILFVASKGHMDDAKLPFKWLGKRTLNENRSCKTDEKLEL